jgi:hypothetical protein
VEYDISPLSYLPRSTQEKASEKPTKLTIIPNINSPKSLLLALKAKGYDKLEGTGKKELGRYKGDELITNLMLYRQAEKLLSGFIAGFYETQVKKWQDRD